MDLTSLTDEEMAENNNDILLIKGGKTQKLDADAEIPDDEEHTKQEDEMTKEVKENRMMCASHGDEKLKNLKLNGPMWTLKLNYQL